MSRLAIKTQKFRSGSSRKTLPPSLQGNQARSNSNSGSASSHLPYIRLNGQARQYREKLVTASQVGHILGECTVFTELYDRLSRSVTSLFPQADGLYIYQVDPLHHAIRFMHAAQNRKELADKILPAILPSDTILGLPGEVLRSASPLLINDLDAYASLHGCSFPEQAGGGSCVQSLLLTPMMSRKSVLGILELLSCRKDGFTRADADLLLSIGSTAALALQNMAYKEDLDQANRALTKTYESTIESWRRALELRDTTTESHASRVAEMTVRLGAWLGVERRELVFLRFGAVLHDIGKIGIPDSVLLKPGPLAEDEMGLMRKHPAFAFEMLSSLPNFAPVLEIPYYHHERWDGTGYPNGLEGEQIPLGARIFAVIDVWDALCSDRPYRQAWPEERALRHIQDESGKHFDPQIVEAFLALVITRKFQSQAA